MKTRIYISKVTVSTSTGGRSAPENIARDVERALAVGLSARPSQSGRGGSAVESALSRSIADAVMQKVRP